MKPKKTMTLWKHWKKDGTRHCDVKHVKLDFTEEEKFILRQAEAFRKRAGECQRMKNQLYWKVRNMREKRVLEKNQDYQKAY